MLQKTTLRFPSAYSLWKFKQVCQVRHLEVDFDSYKLTGEFQKEDIEKAIKEFSASILNPVA